MLLESSPVSTPLPSEKWLICCVLRLLSLAIVLKWLEKPCRGHGCVSISSKSMLRERFFRKGRFLGTCKGGRVSREDERWSDERGSPEEGEA